GAVDATPTPTVRGKEAPPSSPTAAQPPQSAAPSAAEPLARRDAGPSSLGDGERGLHAPPASPCPEDMALVAGQVCVDRWEAALVVVLPDGEEKDWSPYRSPPPERVPVGPTGARLRAVSRAGVVPQGYLSGAQAAEACAAAGKRLCQPEEWERACRGPDDTAFPYGDERRRGVCNDGGRSAHPVKQAFASLRLPDDRMWYEGMQNPLINQLDHTVARTGEHSGCTNAYGTFDMVGNLHEWVDDPAGTFRGGFYMDTKINGDGCEYATTAHPFDYHDYSTGFRCCLDPRDGG
ncbi:MAG: SUMF1/EgtB/PvdO family nonheme iron enzyme, partial [Myxococcales bacterium]|nr:SUMF1/EgtB/PvdO family nonheme iron enzyme [Myxococcales bacterium]